jgi:hypothetical protein
VNEGIKPPDIIFFTVDASYPSEDKFGNVNENEEEIEMKNVWINY